MIRRIRFEIEQYRDRRRALRAAMLRNAAQEAEQEAIEWLDEAARLDAEADRLVCR